MTCPSSHSQYVACFSVQVPWTTHSPWLEQGGGEGCTHLCLKCQGGSHPQNSSPQQLWQRFLLWRGGLWRQVVAPTKERIGYLNLNLKGGWSPRQGHAGSEPGEVWGQRAPSSSWLCHLQWDLSMSPPCSIFSYKVRVTNLLILS